MYAIFPQAYAHTHTQQEHETLSLTPGLQALSCLAGCSPGGGAGASPEGCRKLSRCRAGAPQNTQKGSVETILAHFYQVLLDFNKRNCSATSMSVQLRLLIDAPSPNARKYSAE